MKDSKQLLNQLEQKIAVSPSNSATAAGQTEQLNGHEPAQDKNALVDAINQSFELLRINYHHLYFSAYKEVDALNAAKRLWLESLSHFSPEVILNATHAVIKHSDFLPTISKVVKQCVRLTNLGDLPDAHSAYIEACNAPRPRQNYSWSHPAVYHAARRCGWQFLVSSDEDQAFPVFKDHYEKLCEDIANGHTLPVIEKLALPETIETPLSREESLKQVDELLKMF